MALKALEGSLLYSPKRSYQAVVAIDFGTTYSGFAFSFIKDKGKDAIFMNKDWANEQGGQTSKTPTCLLLKPDLSFDSFGYEAIEKYSSLQNAGVGKPGNADQLMIALEPEAAAIFCKEKNMNDFLEESGSRSLDGWLSQINTHYVVVDIGGGTLDVTVHEIHDGRIKEIHKVTGGPHGGMYVNQQFESLLDELFGTTTLQSYREQFPSDWLCLMSEFEAKKREKRILDSSLMTNIRLPRSFVSQIKQNKRMGIDRYGEREVKIKSNDYLSLGSGMMRKLFTPVVDNIKEHLNNLLGKPQLSKVQTMLLVGGFAESVFLQSEIKKTFSGRCRILVPHHASIAVAQGAVIFGKKPTTITERVMSTTYGIRCRRKFKSGEHPEEKKSVIDGIVMCKDLFSCLVKENDVVELGQRIKKIYHPSTPSSTRATVGFHVTTNPNTQFTSDPGVTEIGKISIQTPDTWKGKDRDIEVSLFFGGTEITATAWDESSENHAETTLDFFTQS